MLMGSLTQPGQIDLKSALEARDKSFGVDHEDKAKRRAAMVTPWVHENADGWWKESGRM